MQPPYLAHISPHEPAVSCYMVLLLKESISATLGAFQEGHPEQGGPFQALFDPKVGTFSTLGKASGRRLSEHRTLHWVLGLRRGLHDSNTNGAELGVRMPSDHGVAVPIARNRFRKSKLLCYMYYRLLLHYPF